MSRVGIPVRPPSSPPPGRGGTSTVVRVVGIVGRVFVGAGLLLLFYTAYLLWGTGVYTNKVQGENKKAIGNNPLVSEQDIVGGKIPPAKPDKPLPPGSPLFTIKIPKIGAESVVVEGVEREQLSKGPGHFPNCNEVSRGADCVEHTSYPGEHGNVAISGHRTTYGAPFWNLQELKKGDVVDIVSGPARYRYIVREQKIVLPGPGYAEVEQHGVDELTLTTCHPRFSATQRLIVHADYQGASLISAPSGATAGGPGTSTAPNGQPVVAPDVLILASVALASALGSLGLSRRYRMWAVYIALGLSGAAGLWIGVFPRVVALMPTNY